MKCKWYAEFEGVCTNGECPYRGDTCPTSEYPEVCKYHNQPEKKLSVGEIVEGLRTCSKGTLCYGCPAQSLSAVDCAKALKEQAADMLEKLAAEKDAKKPEWISVKDGPPENRVLTLEEVEAYCEGGADAAPLWVEFDGGTDGWVLIAPVRETCKMDFVSKYLAIMGILYEKEWRCWLRKPTETERRETPWEGDSHE